jgi:hypothetical protein
MLMKVFAALISLFVLSGCCELFGICTSVAVHTSADSSSKYVREDSGNLRVDNRSGSGSDLTLPLTSTGEPPLMSESSPRCTQKSG